MLKTLSLWINRKKLVDKRSIAVINNIIQSFLIKGFGVFISFLTVPLTLDFIDSQNFSLWMTIYSITLWFTLLDVSFSHGLRNQLVDCFFRKDTHTAKIYVSTLYGILIIITIGLLLCILGISSLVNWAPLFKAPISKEREVNLAVNVVLSSLSIQILLKPINAVLLADQKASIAALILTVSNILSISGIYMVSRFSHGSLLSLALIQMYAPVIVLLTTNIWLFNTHYKKIKPTLDGIRLKYSKLLFNTGSKFMVIQLGNIVLFSAGSLIISHTVGVDYVTPYSIANRYFGAVLMIHGIILTPYWSAFTDAFVQKDTVWLQKTMNKLNQLSGLTAIGVIFMYLVCEFAYQVWVGDRIEVPNFLSLSFAVNTIIYAFMNNYNYFSSGIGNLGYMTKLAAAQILLYIPITIWITRSTEIGVSGVVWIVSIFYLISLLIGIKEYKKSITNLC